MPVLPANADLHALRQSLRRDPVLNTVPLGLVSNALASESDRAELFVALVEEDGEIKAAGLRSQFPGLILAADGDSAAMAELAAIVHAAMPDLPCALGPEAQVLAFRAHWERLGGEPGIAGMPQRVHVLRSVHPAADVRGEMQTAVMEQLDLATDWMRAFAVESLPEEARAEAAIQDAMARRVADGSIYFWVDHHPVSMLGAREFGEGVARIGPVYTPPALRRRGYATALTAAVSGLMLERGCSACCLFTDLDNPTSNHIYAQVGYEPVADFHEFWFRPAR